jgi:flagellar hook assembly protein FlgD
VQQPEQSLDATLGSLMDCRIVGTRVDEDAACAAFVTSLACMQTNAGTAQITFTLSADASVSAEVLNIAGRKVRTIAVDRALDAGTATLLWDGRGTGGAAVPSGAYLIRLQVSDEAGGQSQALGKLRLVR